MRYLLEPNYRKYVQGYGFLSFARKFHMEKKYIWKKNTYGKKLMDTATKTGLDAAKTSGRVVRKAADTTGDLIGNKIADKITSVGKSENKQKEKKNETNEVAEIYILPEKRQQIIDDLRLF